MKQPQAPSVIIENRPESVRSKVLLLVLCLAIAGALYGGYKMSSSNYFFPEDIQHTDSRVAPVREELATWQAELTGDGWSPMVGREPAADDQRQSKLGSPADFSFPRETAQDPTVTGWLAQNQKEDTNYYVHMTWAHSWRPPFNTVEAFTDWARDIFPAGSLTCEAEKQKCEVTGEDAAYSDLTASAARRYSITFNALHSNDFVLDHKGPHVFFILEQIKRER